MTKDKVGIVGLGRLARALAELSSAETGRFNGRLLHYSPQKQSILKSAKPILLKFFHVGILMNEARCSEVKY